MRRRIIGLAVISAVLAIAAFGLPLAAVVGKYMLNAERANLDQATDGVARSITVEVARGDIPDLPEQSAVDVGYTLYDDDRDRVAGDGPTDLEDTARNAFRGSGITEGDTDTEFVVAVALQDGDDVIGVLRGVIPKTRTYLRIAVALALMTALGAAAVGAVWLVARWMAGRLAGPMEDLATAARNVGAGDFSAMAPRSHVPEIDAVGSALNGAAARIAEVVARERAFSADASHQLRTPLTALRLILETAVDTPGQDLHAAVHTALAGTDRLERTIDDLLALARDTRSHAEPLDLGLLLDELRRDWTGPLHAEDRALVIHAGVVPTAAASTAAVRQVLTVLLDNAVRHGTGTVAVDVRDAGDALAVDVADAGAGPVLSESELFTRRSGRASGHGIGLALARSLAEAEGGRLILARRSPPRFSLLIPLTPVPTSGAGTREAAHTG